MVRAATRGAAAGAAGGVAMTASTELEMRLRGREPSRAPVKALRNLLGERFPEDEAGERLAGGAHFLVAMGFGAAHGVAREAGMQPQAAGLSLFAAAMIPDAAAVPALGGADPPWRWSPTEMAISVLHHVVFAGATAGAYAALSGAGPARAQR